MPINQLDVYSSSPEVQTFSLGETGIEDDLFQVLNVDGLDPVKGAISTSPLASVDGASITGEEIPSRNIVLTLRTNPDFVTYSHETLRRALMVYFLPKSTVNLVFDTDLGNLQISGVVESCDANPFTKDPQFIVSIICPDPYFTAVDPTVIDDRFIASLDSWPPEDVVTNNGDVAIGFKLKIPDGFYNLGEIIVQVGSPAISTFHLISSPVDFTNTNIFQMDSRPLQKFVRAIDLSSGSFLNLLSILQAGSKWPLLQPGENLFMLMSDLMSEYPYELTYYEKYGAL